MCRAPIPDKIIKIKVEVFRYVWCFPSEYFISRSFIASPRDKVHQFDLMFQPETPESLRYIASQHLVLPLSFEVSYCHVNLLELVVAIWFRERHIDTELLHESLEVRSVSDEGCGHVGFQASWYSDVLGEPPKGVGTVVIVL
jgi:hypothetical protein